MVALDQQEQKDIDARVKRAAAWQQRQQDKLTDQAAAEKAEAEIAAKVRAAECCNLQQLSGGCPSPQEDNVHAWAASVSSCSLLEPSKGRGWGAAI